MARQDWLPFGNLHGYVRLILCVDWDPIGIFGNPFALDEYDSYASGIVDLLNSGTQEADLVAHLRKLATVNMCVRAPDQDVLVARKLLQVYATVDQ